MKDKKINKKGSNAEVQQLQKLHDDFESQIKKRLALLEVSSKHKLEEKELRESEELFRTTFNHAAIGIAHVDLKDGRWIRVNKRFCEIAGWSEKELLNQTFLNTTHPDDHAEDLRLIENVLQGKVPSITMEKRYVRKDGSIRWVYATASIIRDEHGQPKYGIAIVEDIHEKKQTEERMKLLVDASKILGGSIDYNETLSAVADLMVPQYADWCIIDLLDENNEYNLVKVAHADPRDKKIAEHLYQNASKKHTVKCLSGKAIHSKKPILISEVTDANGMGCQFAKDPTNMAVAKIKTKSLMVIPLIVRGKPLGVMHLRSTSRTYLKTDVFLADQIASRIAFAVDNARLYHQVQKAVSVRDDFLAIASHELKTSLTTIKALAQILQRDNNTISNGNSSTLLKKMDKQLNRTTKLINDLLDVGKIHRGKFFMAKEWLDIDMVVKEAVENCQRFSPDHKIVLKGHTKEKIYADRDRIDQVIVNLITNAIKYSVDAVDIVVTLKKDENNVIISVQDFGIGIEQDKKQKIFERFFRADQARNTTSGLGLGLYISKELIKQHGGFIHVKSKVGKGSTFSIVLPRLTEVAKRGNKTLAQNSLNA